MPHLWLPSEKYTFTSADLIISIPGTNLQVSAPFLAVPVYLFLCLFLLPRLVTRRHEARGLLALHNGFLLVLSLIMFVGTVWACIKALKVFQTIACSSLPLIPCRTAPPFSISFAILTTDGTVVSCTTGSGFSI